MYEFYGEFLPEELQASIDRYIQHGLPVGHFLSAVINNDLKEAVGRADQNNIRILHVIVGYLYNECPIGSWGYTGATDQWIKRKEKEINQ